jgi:putative glutamine amidotransferase
MAVRIGIPACTSGDVEYNRKSSPSYVAAIEGAGGEAVPLPLGRDLAELGALATTCDGFLLPGSPADVEPSLYGQAREQASAPADQAREDCDLRLLEHAAVQGKPVLAICFGMQRMAVWCGGSLVQDLAPVPVNHSAGAQVAVAHSVLVAGQSLLAGLLGAAEAPAEQGYRRLAVNSSHHQAVSTPGDGLVVVARSSEDGVIEAVEGRIGQAAMVGVQWHPERSVEISAASRALFTWLVSEAEDGRMRSEDLSVGAF